MMRRILGGTAALIALAGCTVGPDYHVPPATIAASYKELAGWKPATPADGPAGLAWWTIYRDPQLDALEADVTISNQTLQAAAAAYAQAQALIDITAAAGWPLAVAGTGVRHTGGGNGSAAQTTTIGSFEGALTWDPDIWGRIRRSVESSKAGAEARAADLALATLSTEATLARTYFALRAADAQSRLFDRTIADYRRALTITQNQYAVGAAARSDVVLAETQLDNAEASRTALGVQRAQDEHAIALLIGRTPDQLAIAPSRLARKVPVVPTGLPSTLLERRPDIAEAERTMQQQNALIGVAISAFYPDITLSAVAGRNAGLGLFSVASRVWSLGAAATLPLFEGGLRHAEVAAARAAYDQSVAEYRDTVLAAFQQVEDQLAALRILQTQAAQTAATVAASRQATQIALNEYRAGLTAYTSVVTAQVAELSAEQSAITVQLARLEASVTLSESLGGGWNTGMLPGHGHPLRSASGRSVMG